MIKRRLVKKTAAILTALSCAVSMMGCQGTTDTETTVAAETVETTASTVEASAASVVTDAEEEIDSWKQEAYQEITLNGDSVSTTASGVSVEGTIITITAEGTYVFSGTLTDGQILVEATKDEKVTIVLNGVDISSSTTAPIHVIQADKTILYLADGTENTVTDSEGYEYAEGETEPDAAIFAEDDLTIKGTGSLTVHANYSDGIFCKNDLKITGGNVTVHAVNQGIKGKDSLTVKGGIINVTAGDDGIKSSNDAGEEDGKEVGWVLIEAGDITIDAGDDAVHAESTLTINGGTIHIISSVEGLEGAEIYINGGDIDLYSSDDGINAAGSTTAATTGTETSMKSTTAEYAVAKSTSAPDVPAEGSSAERIPAERDAAEKSWGNRGEGGMGGGMMGGASNGYLEINGGTIYVNADGDGIDVNGGAVMNGGTVIVEGPEDSNNGSLDYDTTFVVNGGTLLTIGSAGMAQTVSDSSAVNTVTIYTTTTESAGSEITITDAAGDIICSYTPSKSYSFVSLSHEKLTTDSTYTIQINGAEYDTFTVSSVLTTVGTSMGMGGMGGHGGNRGMKPGTDGTMPEGMTPPEGMEVPEGTTPPEGMPVPEGETAPTTGAAS